MNNFFNENSIYKERLFCPHCNHITTFQSTGLVNKHGIEFACNNCGYTKYIYKINDNLEYGEL